MEIAASSLRVKNRARKHRIVAVSFFLILLVILVDSAGFPWGQGIQAPIADRAENGLWVRYTYAFGENRDTEVTRLAQRISQYGIKFAYFHVRGTSDDGELVFHHPAECRKLTDKIRSIAPATRSFAWVYVGNSQAIGGTHVDLNNPQTRKVLIKEASWLIKTCGFDGIQWDYEVCQDGELGLLKLLEESRTSLPSGTPVSICTPTWYPFSPRIGWTEEYFKQVASRCDQVAVMCYDTGFITPRSYLWLTQEQVLHVTRACRSGNPNVQVLIGIPTYGAGLLAHNPHAENLKFALRAVREGAKRVPSNNTLTGVALFADYTTDDSEWKTYQRFWEGK